MKLLRYSFVSLVIVLGYIAIVASFGDGPVNQDLDSDGYVISEDCDDTRAYVNPDHSEICGDGLDNNCDGNIDEIGCGDRFTDMTDGTVRDNKTGLIWLKDANALGYDTRDNAMTAAATLDAEDFEWLTDGSSEEDWRLPTIEEWQAFVDTTYTYPALSNAAGDDQCTEGDAFTGVQSTHYWSSTELDTDDAWDVYMGSGNAHYGSKGDGYYVWPVRSDN
jgi:hypothetical protein